MTFSAPSAVAAAVNSMLLMEPPVAPSQFSKDHHRGWIIDARRCSPSGARGNWFPLAGQTVKRAVERTYAEAFIDLLEWLNITNMGSYRQSELVRETYQNGLYIDEVWRTVDKKEDGWRDGFYYEYRFLPHVQKTTGYPEPQPLFPMPENKPPAEEEKPAPVVKKPYYYRKFS